MTYKIDKKWFKRDSRDGSIDNVVVGKRSYRIGRQKVTVRGKEAYRGEMPEDQELLKALHDMGKEYVIAVDNKPKKVKKVKDEPKDINQESKKVSVQKKESE